MYTHLPCRIYCKIGGSISTVAQNIFESLNYFYVLYINIIYVFYDT
jgi:hypothetical protein